MRAHGHIHEQKETQQEIERSAGESQRTKLPMSVAKHSQKHSPQYEGTAPRAYIEHNDGKDSFDEEQAVQGKDRNTGKGMWYEAESHQAVLCTRPEQPQYRVQRNQSGMGKFLKFAPAMSRVAHFNRFTVVGKKQRRVCNITLRPGEQEIPHCEGRSRLAAFDELIFLFLKINWHWVQISNFPVWNGPLRLDHELGTAHGDFVCSYLQNTMGVAGKNFSHAVGS